MNFIKQKTYQEICILLFFYSFLLQIFLIPKLPAKYFYDSTGILSICNDTYSRYFDSSYLFTGKFFRLINIFNIRTFSGWAYVLTFFSISIIVHHIYRYRKVDVGQLLYIVATITFANIYIFRISKDFIQFIFWCLLYVIIKLKISEKKKNVLIFSLFIFEAIFFRAYYIIIGIAYFVLKFIIKKRKEKNIKISKLIVLITIGIIVGLSLLNKVYPKGYNDIVNLRYNINYDRLNSVDAVTAIIDVFPNKNALMYVANYFINLIRMLFPFELCVKGVKYLPFVIYQVYFTIKLVHSLKSRDTNEKMMNLIIMVTAYLLTSNLYEPDFGSVVRHETALMFILFDIIMKKGESDEKYITKN